MLNDDDQEKNIGLDPKMNRGRKGANANGAELSALLNGLKQCAPGGLAPPERELFC
jgi:hypothetical protein